MTPDRKNTAPTAQKSDGGGGRPNDVDGWMVKARAAYLESSTFFDNNLRRGLDDSIRAFNNQHASDSKYNSIAYEKRSRLFRPKIRSIIRKNEAAAAAAFFSNMDVVDITALDQGDKIEQASSEIMKELLQYRLTKSIPWFQTLLGGLQDAQSTGVVCAHVYWDYKARPEGPGEEEGETLKQEETEQEDEYPRQGVLPEGAEAVEAGKTETTAPAITEKPLSQLGVVSTPLPSAPPPQAGSAPLPMPMGGAAPQPAATGGQQPVADQPSQVKPTPKPVAESNPPLVDKPCVDLIPVENIRISPAASWIDPINSSPYVIHMIPMYIMDVKDKIEAGEWFPFSEAQLSAGNTKSDSTRTARQKDRDDPYGQDGSGATEYEICWVQRHIHRKDDVDWEFYVLDDIGLLSTPKPLHVSVFHGRRPYIMGNCILEAHRSYPSSMSQIGKGLQDEANEVVNQRIDNVKFVLNKKWFIKRGKDVDIQGLVRNVPGGVVSMDDPEKDVREISWPDVTQSAYEEQSRIDNDLAELLGNFSPAQVMADHGINGPARNMAMLSQSAGTLVEYLLRTYVETFVQPVLRQIILLEQEYETDQVILSLAAKKSKTFQRFHMEEVTDQLLNKELTLNVNVGMGSTDPGTKLQKFMTGVTNYAQIVKLAPPGLNLQEVGKEVFGHLGYQDGTRFFTDDNPAVAALKAQMEAMQKQMEELHNKAQDKMAGHTVKTEVAKATNQNKLEIAKLHEENENLRASIIHLRAITEEEKLRNHELHKLGLEHAHEIKQGFKVVK